MGKTMHWWVAVAGLAGCGGASGTNPFESNDGSATGGASTGGSATGGATTGGDETDDDAVDGTGGTTGSADDTGGDGIKFDTPDGATAGDDGPPGGDGGGDPTTCAEAEEFKTYVGCDFWPTVTANNVWSVFDYAVVVANAGEEEAEVTVERGGVPIGEVTTIPPDELRTIYLPWVPELKGPDSDECGSVVQAMTQTVRVPDGAYHLQSSVPVTVYQFNPLEYAPEGGPPGKDWSSCPAPQCTLGVQCYSYSNDASLLLPSPAYTTNYRVTGYPGWPAASVSGTIAVTGTVDGTDVTVSLSSTGALAAGGGIAAAGPGGVVTFPIDRGEAVELLGTPDTDLSGTLVQATEPVQVIFGLSCTQVPYGTAYCDHIEETVVPAETLGAHYFVTVPTSPNSQPVAHMVRIYGNVDGTVLTYPQGKPAGFPDTVDAGQVVQVGYANLVINPFANPPISWDLSVTTDFEIEGDHEFAVASLQFGADALGDGQIASAQGDPAQSLTTPVEQFRTKYVFLAPTDYAVGFADVVQPMDADVQIDGAPAGGNLVEIGTSGYGVRRVTLGDGNAGAHVLTASAPVGLQVIGYGDYTSYQYPGGLNLEVIAPPPPPPG